MKNFERRVLERMPSSEEEHARLGRVWNQVERAGGQIPDDVLRSVQERSASRHQRARPFLPKAVAAMLVLGAAIGTAIVWPRGVQAFAAGNDGLQVTLADDSRVEMRAHAEMTVDHASDGIQIDLKKGDIIVTAARQRDGRLSVRTKDVTVAVEGTVFLVNGGSNGSRVAVIEGEVQVREGTVETRLRPGEELATSPAVARRPLTEEIAWSRNADAHLAILESFRRGIARTTGALSPVVPESERQQGKGAVAPAPVEFEEASIRSCDPDNLPPPPPGARGGGANSLQMTPGRLYALCLSPATLIRTSLGVAPGNFFGPAPAMKSGIVYGLGVEDGQRVRGGPDWVRSEFYTVEAVAGGSADAETMSGPMLRALLERRFGLKTHIETEALPAFALTVASGGHKMREGLCDGPQLGPAPPPADLVRKNLDVIRRGATPGAPCGFGGVRNGPNILFVSAGAGFAFLREILGVPVINRTNFPQSARYSYVLEFQPDERTPGARGYSRIDHDAQLAADPASVPSAPDIVTALERQLGLRLEPERQPREYIVIDAIQRPPAN